MEWGKKIESFPPPLDALIGLALVLTLTSCAPTAMWGDVAAGAAARGVQYQAPPHLPREDIPYFYPYASVALPKLPQAHPDAKPNPGMSDKEYWDHLCRLEAGEFIYKTAEDVKGIYLIRPRFWIHPNEKLLMDRFAIEDPYGAPWALRFEYQSFPDWAHKGGYQFVEMPVIDKSQIPHYDQFYMWGWDSEAVRYTSELVNIRGLERRDGNGSFYRYHRSGTEKVSKKKNGQHVYEERFFPLIEERVATLDSRYGVLWRGIDRPEDRARGIGGGEVIVLDLDTNEVMAVRRGFSHRAVMTEQRGDFHWRGSATCPSQETLKEDLFVKKVLKPFK